MSGQHEFSSEHNVIFSKLATAMKFVGIFQIVLGVLCMLALFSGDVGAIIQGVVTGVVYILVGILLARASNHLRKIVDTEGSDIDHLMNAMGDISILYNVSMYIVIVAIVVVCCSFAILLFL